ncbi:MAG: hypothetical protein WBC91_09245 [Phototrophicaceae bacterium]
MNRNMLRGFLQIGFFVGGGGFLLALAHPPDSPEFVASVLSGILGLILIIGAIAVSYFLG